jgi:rhodanese-related sulfurtransferase
MKHFWSYALAAACVGLGQHAGYAQRSNAQAGSQQVKTLHASDLKTLLANPEQVLILDLRSPGEIAYWGAFPVFVSVDLGDSDAKAVGLSKHLAEIPKDREIVTVSGRPEQAEAAAALLATRGFKVAGAVGARTYAVEGGQLVTFKPYTHWSMNGGQPPNGRNPMAARDEPKTFKELHRAEIETLMTDPEKVLILDVRSPGEIAYWGAFPVFLDVQSSEGDSSAAGIEKHLAEIPKDKPLVTVSGRANRSGFAAAMLEQRGFKVIGAIGAMTFGEEGGHLIKEAPYKPPTQDTK